jgi:hypothetical protein
LKLDHQLNQLVLAQPLQISAIHAHMDSEIAAPGKGNAEINGLAPIRPPKMGVGNYNTRPAPPEWRRVDAYDRIARCRPSAPSNMPESRPRFHALSTAVARAQVGFLCRAANNSPGRSESVVTSSPSMERIEGHRSSKIAENDPPSLSMVGLEI